MRSEAQRWGEMGSKNESLEEIGARERDVERLQENSDNDRKIKHIYGTLEHPFFASIPKLASCFKSYL